MQTPIAHDKKVDIEQLKQEIAAAMPKAATIRTLAEPHTLTVNGSVQYKGYQVNIEGDFNEQEQAIILAVIENHNPQQSTQEKQEADRKAARLLEFADVIAEAVRQAKEGK
jgi:hypothetical protein